MEVKSRRRPAFITVESRPPRTERQSLKSTCKSCNVTPAAVSLPSRNGTEALPDPKRQRREPGSFQNLPSSPLPGPAHLGFIRANGCSLILWNFSRRLQSVETFGKNKRSVWLDATARFTFLHFWHRADAFNQSHLQL